jgi:hypothetical protein
MRGMVRGSCAQTGQCASSVLPFYEPKYNTNERCWHVLDIDHFWANDFEFYELVFLKSTATIFDGFGWIIEVYYVIKWIWTVSGHSFP